jgi:DinB superfamily
METCEGCGFSWDDVEADEIAPRVLKAALEIGRLLRSEPSLSTHQPRPERWSAIEYGAHVRDVLLTIRDRVVIGLVEQNPSFKPMYRDERISLGLYEGDTPPVIADEVESTARLFLRFAAAIDPTSMTRSVRYGFPDPMPRTILWMLQQAVHESEHHLTDIKENLGAE